MFALLDPDPDSGSGSTGPIESGSNPDPDPKPCNNVSILKCCSANLAFLCEISLCEKKNTGFYSKAFFLQLTFFVLTRLYLPPFRFPCVGRMLGMNSRIVEK
jgi:hypothetical protein